MSVESVEKLATLRENIVTNIAQQQEQLKRVDELLDIAKAEQPPVTKIYQVQPHDRRIGLEDVLGTLNIKKSKFYDGVKNGIFPRGHGKGKGHYWLMSEIQACLLPKEAAASNDD